MKSLVGQYGGPYIDEKVEHVGVSRLRSLNKVSLRDFDRTLVIQENDKPLAVLLPYEQFLVMQRQLVSLFQTVQLLKNKKEIESVTEGMQAAVRGKIRPLAEVEAEINKEEET